MRVQRLLGRFGVSLSARLLLLTIFFVMLAEMLIFVPSVARDRLAFFEDRLSEARLAVFALEATPESMVSQTMADRLLDDVGAVSIIVHKPDQTLMIDPEDPPVPGATFDLRGVGMFTLIRDAIETLMRNDDRILRVFDNSPKEPGVMVEVLLYEQPLRAEMWSFGERLLGASFILSLITGAFVWLSLQWLLVRPMRRLTHSMIDFRENPDDATRVITPAKRRDEFGAAERELASMQERVRQALAQKERLAALGSAVTKINHDLKNILATMRLLSDGITANPAPELRRIAPGLAAAIDRAVALTTGTLDYTRDATASLRRSRFALAGLVEEMVAQEWPSDAALMTIANEVSPRLIVAADRDQLFRVLHNLALNAGQAGARNLSIRAVEAEATLYIEFADDGPGLPPKARENLFRPFAGSARPGGTGLGLAIARDVMRAHGGDITLDETTGSGTIFRLSLPRAAQGAIPAPKAAP